MKRQHIQRKWKSPFFVNFKKHYCTECGGQLVKIEVSKIVNSNSPEAKKIDFEAQGTFMIGNVKFIWTELKCPKCKKQYTVDELKKLEKEKKKKGFDDKWQMNGMKL